jgi:Uma2 family endonuclease
MRAMPLYHSADMVRAIPADGNRYETVHGELLVTPAPSLWHQEVVTRLMVQLHDYLQLERVGIALAAPADISWGPETLVQPDLFVAPLPEARTLEWDAVRTLLLAIEVLSPATGQADRFTKRRLYQQVGVTVYWLVDPDGHSVRVWKPQTTVPVVEHERVVWSPVEADTSLVIELRDLFRPI